MSYKAVARIDTRWNLPFNMFVRFQLIRELLQTAHIGDIESVLTTQNENQEIYDLIY